MVLGPGGTPARAPAKVEQALRIGRIVHAFDGQHCAPFIINIVNDEANGIIGGKVFPYGVVVDGIAIQHDARPDIPPKIQLPDGQNKASWHWPGECPWHR